MATLSATVSSTSITLSDGAPYSLLSATGMGGADIRRVTVRGPAQDGDTDVGYRLGPREIELVIGFKATTDALLDSYRDTLTSFFKPLTATPVKLRVVRDDGEIRQIDTNLIGSIRIDLDRTLRPGHYHRATVRLRAADPAWYELAPGTVTFVGSVSFLSNWWLAGGVIGTAQVLMHGGTPSQNEAWSYAGTIPGTTSWTLGARALYRTAAGTASSMFTVPGSVGWYPSFGVAGTETYGTAPTYYLYGSAVIMGTEAMRAGTQVYFYGNDPNGFSFGNGVPYPTFKTYWNGIDFGLNNFAVYPQNMLSSVPGTNVVWKTGGWSEIVQLYALYSPGLSADQRYALAAYMHGVAGTVATTLVVSYEGDLPEYPIISLTGPIANPIITNTATGESLDFTGTTIGAGTTYVIDTRYGYKTVKQGTTTKIDQLSDDSDLSTWHLAPSPIATGGTNVIAVYGSGNGSATSISLVYYNRFPSY